MHVLDSSAFIHDYHTTEQTATIPLVREELEDESVYRYDAMEGSGMHVHIPNEDTTEKIRRAARESGDLEVLSETDVRLVATAFELDGTLVTDDYAMQNVAEKLNVDVEVIARIGGRTSTTRVPLGFTFGYTDDPEMIRDFYDVQVITRSEEALRD